MSQELLQEKSYIISRDRRGVVSLHLNRPKIHNAFDEILIRELNILLEEMRADESIRLLTLSGEGKHFCAGADLRWMKKMKSFSYEENYEDSMALAELFENLNQFPVPVLAKCQGAAMGGGAGLLSVCDFVVASQEASFAFSEVKLGLIPAVISPYVTAKIGESQARAYFLSGMLFGASEALSMGLVHAIVSDGQSLDESFENMVQRFLKCGPRAVRQAKSLIRIIGDQIDWPSYCGELRPKTCRLIANQRITKEAQEVMQALLEKRPPNWLAERK